MEPTFLARWFDGAAIAVALAAALALAVTVLVARGELQAASLAMVRGEGESLAARLHERGERYPGPPTSSLLEEQLGDLRADGLRFLAIDTPSGVISAGESRIDHVGRAPGTILVQGGRALLVSPVPAPRPPSPMKARDDRGDERFGPSPPRGAPSSGRPSLVLEFEPAILARLRTGTNHTLVVACAAVVVLLAFAAALSARMFGRAKIEAKAEHERRLAALGQMAGVMAHELRNPLTSLKGNAQLLAEMLATGTREQVKAEVVVAEAVRLERLTQDLLAFVRDESVIAREVTPSALLERALRDFPVDRIERDLAAAPPTIWVDEARLCAAIGNLVQNALQATDGEESVRVRISGVDGDVVIEVHDEGPGVRVEDRERVFEPFFTTRIHGTGLGLAVARRSVEQHGGTLRVEPSLVRGAVFRIRLPGATRGTKDGTD